MGCKVLNKQDIARLETFLMEEQLTPGLVLMENAGRTVAERVALDLDTSAKCVVLCGKGKNGGDGYVVARQLHVLGINAIVWAVGGADSFSLDTQSMFRCARAGGVTIHEIRTDAELESCRWQLSQADAIVDALCGTGLNRPIEGIMARVVNLANEALAPVYAVDMPSGVDADSGQMQGAAIRAKTTITFFAHKPGQLIFPGRKLCGEVVVAPLCKVDLLPKAKKAQWLIETRDLERALLPRRMDAHKGDNGRAFLVGGSAGLNGAVGLAAFAAVRSGSGLLRVAVPESCAATLWGSVPEAMAYPVAEMDGKLCSASIPGIEALLEGQTCAAIGPGLGKGPEIREIVLALSRHEIPLVIDADGLNAIAGHVDELCGCAASLILTPHPMEMARLCGIDVETVLRAPVETARKLAVELGAVVLLKGPTSVIVSPDGRVSYNTSGGPQLAKGGSGDVLTGMILALLAQGLKPYQAARMGALLLGKAADCVRKDEKTVLARDVIEAIPLAFAK